MRLKCPAALTLAIIASALPTVAHAQTAASPITQTLQSSLSAMLGKNTLSDATLSGTASWTAGSDEENGTFTFRGAPSSGSRTDLNLTSGTRSEISSLRNGTAVGAWSGADGVQHAIASHNLLAGAGWPLPAFQLMPLLQDPTIVVSYLGLEGNLIHFAAYRQPPGASKAMAASLQHLTRVELWLSSATLLPARINFSIHPDKNAAIDIPVRIEFSNYQTEGGILIPTHVQKYLNGTLLLDLQIQSAAINTGIPASEFSIQN